MPAILPITTIDGQEYIKLGGFEIVSLPNRLKVITETRMHSCLGTYRKVTHQRSQWV